MTSFAGQIAASIKILISARDYKGADVQPVIDALFAQWESMNAKRWSPLRLNTLPTLPL